MSSTAYHCERSQRQPQTGRAARHGELDLPGESGRSVVDRATAGVWEVQLAGRAVGPVRERALEASAYDDRLFVALHLQKQERRIRPLSTSSA
jgi:hypothetical protein